MKNLTQLLKKHQGKKMLLIFPHPDDEAYVSGGLLQVAQELSIHTKLICLTKGGRGILPKDKELADNLKGVRIRELDRACSILGVDEVVVWDYPDGNLIGSKSKWLLPLKNEVIRSKASIIITFDQSGITGHPDHLVIGSEVFKLLKSLKTKPVLLLRVPDKQELNYFKKNKYLSFSQVPTHEVSYSFAFSVKKIRAIFAHKSQLISKLFALQILEWFLFDHKELYHLVDYKKHYPLELRLK